ncbi:MAG TPA: hypothetical protein VE866_04515 [Candidatus Binatia bacterium]|nr:hypothetical protein [Candidatus Binatia bacterium]
MIMSSVFMGIVWDMSNAWMHKQWADAAAQSACSAGMMDMVWAASNGGANPTTPVSSMNFLPAPGTTNSGDCGTNPSNPICYYAKINGYDSRTQNDVQWATSNTPPSSELPNNTTTMTQSTNGVPAFLTVTVTDNVPAFFFGIFSKFLGMPSSWQSVPVSAHCNCGMTGTWQPGGGSSSSTTNLTDSASLSCSAGKINGVWYGSSDDGYNIYNDCSGSGAISVNQAVAANATVTVTASIQLNFYSDWTSNGTNGVDWYGTCNTMPNKGTTLIGVGGTGKNSYNQTTTVTFTCPAGSITNLNQIALYGYADLWVDYMAGPAHADSVATFLSAEVDGPPTSGTWTNITAASFY